ncbi:hypothetical protein NHQ30_006562 [Ciborinia camelliae]|nr:hypothetical protein NHQ30_006562 [Ciborinia camelliae]
MSSSTTTLNEDNIPTTLAPFYGTVYHPDTADHTHHKIIFSGTKYEKNPAYTTTTTFESDKLYFPNMQYQKVKTSDSKKIYIALPKSFTDWISKTTAQVCEKYSMRVKETSTWKPGFEPVDRIPATDYRAPEHHMYIQLSVLPVEEEYGNLKFHGDGGVYEGFVKFISPSVLSKHPEFYARGSFAKDNSTGILYVPEPEPELELESEPERGSRHLRFKKAITNIMKSFSITPKQTVYYE